MPADRTAIFLERVPRTVSVPLILLAIVVVAAALKLATPVTLPVVASIILTMLLLPIQSALAPRLPKRLGWLSTTAAMGAFVLALALVAGAIWWAFSLTAQTLPQYQDQLIEDWESFRSWLSGLGVPTQRIAEGDMLRGRVASFAESGVLTAGELLVGLIIVFFLTILFLIEVERWRDKSREAWEQKAPLLNDTTHFIAHKVRQYLAARTLVSAISAVAAGLWLWAMGVDLAFVWALLVFALNFIPNIGSIIAAIPPILFAFVQFGIGKAAIVALGIFAIEQIVGNYIDPRVQGRTLDISPAIVLIAVIFWTFIWGPIGALLAVPVTVAAIVALAQIPSARWVAVMLSRSNHVPTLDKAERV